MPDELRNFNGETDWVKIIMAISTAVLLVLNGVGYKYHENTRGIQKEHAKVIEQVVTRADILQMIKDNK